jgi:hypothetical protein
MRQDNTWGVTLIIVNGQKYDLEDRVTQNRTLKNGTEGALDQCYNIFL